MRKITAALQLRVMMFVTSYIIENATFDSIVCSGEECRTIPSYPFHLSGTVPTSCGLIGTDLLMHGDISSAARHYLNQGLLYSMLKEIPVWTITRILLCGPLGTNFSESWLKAQQFSCMKSSVWKCSPQNGGHFASANVLITSTGVPFLRVLLP